MIERLKHQPTEFKHLEEPHQYLAFHRTDGTTTWLCALLAIRADITGTGIIHIHPIKEAWNHNTLKAMKKDWPKIVYIFKGMGCHQLVATGLGESEYFTWWERFIQHFGFPKPKPVFVSCQEV